jgi:thioesterase domain-containing protein/aryl carrier-like protein
MARDAIELKLKQIWEDLLGHRPVGVHDNFFEIGGDSVLAMSLMALVIQETGSPISAAEIFRAPTISKLADTLRSELAPDNWTALVPIQPGGSRPPVYCVHPGGGNVLCYLQLSRLLGPEQPFYGLQAPGIDGVREPLSTVNEMAKEYVQAIRAAQPQGPYTLAGWSVGGVIAFEMAQQFHMLGEEVSNLAILDSGVLYTFGVLQAMFPQGQPGALAFLRQPTQQQVAEFRARSAPAKLVPEEADDKMAAQILGLFSGSVRAVIDYRPQPYDGRIDLFQASKRLVRKQHQPLAEWSRVCDDVRLHDVAGSHLTMIHDPHVQGLAEKLGQVLSAACTSN